MSRACSVCTHAERDSVDRDLLAGTPNTRIAARIAVSEQAIRRHRSEHLPEKLAQADGAATVAEATDLLQELRVLRSKAYSLLLRAEREGDLKTALMGIREARQTLELLLEIEGEIDRRPQVNVLITPEWQRVRGVLLDALRGYPEARTVVSARLVALEAAG